MDGTEKLCLKLYGKEKPEHYIDGSNSKMLHDAVRKIEALEQRLETGHNDTPVIHIQDWHDDIGDCLWWESKESAMCESAVYIGSPLSSDFPDYLSEEAVFIPHPNYSIE